MGGGFSKSGVHNVLEPAVFGVPVLIGDNYKKYNEVVDLIEKKGCYSINKNDSFSEIVMKFLLDDKLNKFYSKNSKEFINSNLGGTKIIIHSIEKIIKELK